MTIRSAAAMSVAIAFVVGCSQPPAPAPATSTVKQTPAAPLVHATQPPAPKTREALHLERLQEAYDEFGGILYHGDSPPREVLIGGIEWQRTNARTMIENGTNRAGVPYRYSARIYLSADKTRRLAVHSREKAANEFGVHLLVVEQIPAGQKLNGDELWIADGFQVVAQGYPTSVSWFCASKANGETVWELPPHKRRSRDGALIPVQLGDTRPDALKRAVGDSK